MSDGALRQMRYNTVRSGSSREATALKRLFKKKRRKAVVALRYSSANFELIRLLLNEQTNKNFCLSVFFVCLFVFRSYLCDCFFEFIYTFP